MTTSPATSCSPSAAATSPTSTSSPVRSWTRTGGSGRSGSRSPGASSPSATGSSACATPTASASRTAPRGTVERIDLDRRALVVATDRGPTVELSRRYLEAGNVRHAYALTGHAAQGLTVERAFVLGAGEARLQEWGYVALSRARAQTRLYVTGDPREHESHFHDLDDRDPLTRFGRALEESAVELLAVDQRPLPSGPRHEARPEIERSRPSPDDQLHLRLLEHKRLALVKTRDVAERRLEAAERSSRNWSRSVGAVVTSSRAEIELQRGAIDLVKEELAQTAALLEESKLEIRGVDRISERSGPERDPHIRRRRELTVTREW